MLINKTKAIYLLGVLCLAATAAHARVETGTLTGNYLAGQFARTQGDNAAAIRYLSEAHRQSPQDKDITAQLLGLMLLEGQVDAAVSLADETPVAAREPISFLLLSLRAMKAGDLEGAARELQPAFATDSAQLWLPLVSAWIDAGRGRLDKPLSAEELTADIGRASTLVHYHLALINWQAGFIDAAAADFKEAVADAKNPPGRMIEALLQFQRRHRHALLAPLADEYLADHPEAPPGEPVAATPKAGVAEVLLTMGIVMQAAGVEQDAAIYLQLALYLDPTMQSALLTLGDMYADLGKRSRAEAAYARIPESSPLYLQAQLRRAMNLNRMGKLDEALALLGRVAARFPEEFEMSVAKGDLLRLHARFPEAVAAYDQAIARIGELKSHHWPVLFARGACLERIGSWPQAERDLKRALELKPDQPDVMNYLGFTWLTRGEHLQEAHDMLQRAVAARPNDAQIVDSMGWALYLLGKYGEAADYLEKAVQLLPGDPTVNDHLGDAYWRLGRRTEARFQWERSLTFSPDETLAESIRRKLKDGLSDAPAQAEDAPPLRQAMRQPAPAPVAE